MTNTLLLDINYRPLQTVPWQRAMCLIFKEKVEVLKFSDKTVKTPTTEYQVPLVIRLIKLIRQIYKNSVTVTKNNIAIRDNYTCQYCNKRIYQSQLTLDHIIPSSKGGKSTWENLVCCCQKCNLKKGNKLLSEINMKLIRKPIQPTISEFLSMKLKTDGLSQTINDFLNSYR